ncbi:MAG: nucleotidyltransferase [Acidobacteria bacterium]|nr:nucleotidyltransferase [Acidobacteriota bacterium]
MNARLAEALDKLRSSEQQLRSLNALHLAIFGSVARGDASPDSDLDILVELDPARQLGLFEYSRLRLEINALLGGSADIVNKKTLKPLIRPQVERDLIHVF